MSRTSKRLRSPVVVLAFGGWNDAADAASDALAHLRETYPTTWLSDLDDEEFFDFQETRPMVRQGPDGRYLSWPRITLSKVELPDRDLVIFEGPEPSLKWRSFAALVVGEVVSLKPRTVVLLGAMLSDSPHSRPLPLTGSAVDKDLAERLNLERSTYEGPTGIIGVLADAMPHLDLPVVSLWTAVPHYVANPPCPKATLVLMHALENVLGEPLELGDLPERAVEWEQKVNELMDEDADIAEYVASLESMSDEVEKAEGSGEEIAAAFERYLQDRGDA